MRVGGEIFKDGDAPVEPGAFFYLAAPLFDQARRDESPPQKNMVPSKTWFLIYRGAAFLSAVAKSFSISECQAR